MNRRSMAVARCAGMILISAAHAAAAAAAPGAPTIADIVEARSIDSLSLSPDGRKIAYRVLAPSIARNRLEAQWRVRDLSDGDIAQDLGRPSEPIQQPLFAIPYDGVARWASDGKGLYVLAADAAGVQIHRIAPAGLDSRITNDPADVVDFDVEPATGALRYHIFDIRADIEAAEIREEQHGIHLDRSVITDGLRLTDNYRIGDHLTTIRRIDAGDTIAQAHRGDLRTVVLTPEGTRPVTEITSDLRTAMLDVSAPDAANRVVRLPGLFAMHIAIRATPGLEARGPRYQYFNLEVDRPGRPASRCDDPQCPSAGNGLREATINPDTREIVMLTERGQSALTIVTGWNPLTNSVRTIYRADTSLDGGSRYSGASCPRIDHFLICVEAGAAQPDRLIKIDLDTGRRTILDDPNRALRAMRFAPVRPLHWTDAVGRPSDGVLLLPSAPSSRPLPLVITTYRCRGFLRGGTGWLAPEHILAQEGFAVLCASTNDLGWGAKDNQGALIPINAHKVYLDALKAVIDQLSREGIVDPGRVGITGHSLSSNTIAYAISHTSLFRAAVLGGSYDLDPFSYSLTATTADSWRKPNFAMMGLGAPSDATDRVWDAVSPSRHAASVTAALLMQPPESEYLLGLDLFARMQDAGIPSDMFVYPHEGHMVGIEPLHQYWRNLRSVDWLSFWLLGREHRTSETAAQYDLWEHLRAQDKRVAPTAGLAGDAASRDRHEASQASTSTSVRMRE